MLHRAFASLLVMLLLGVMEQPSTLAKFVACVLRKHEKPADASGSQIRAIKPSTAGHYSWIGQHDSITVVCALKVA
eukprot:scaffold9945_cov182-Amphora_coffeaeformis.AAC.3